MKKLKRPSQAGFSLIELLVAFIILVVAYTVLLHFHTTSLETFRHARGLFKAITKLELFIAGEPIPDIKTTSHTLKIKGYTITEKTYETTCDNVTAYFRIYE